MEFLNEILTNKQLIWPLQIFAIILGSFTISLIVTRVITRTQKKLLKNNNRWDDLAIVAIRRPVKTLIWIIGIAFAIDISNQYSKTDFSYISTAIKDLGLIFTISWSGWRLIRSYENRLTREKTKKKIDITTASAVIKLLRASLVITFSLVTLQTLGVSINGVLAFGGVGGIAIGFAAKDLLANFFGAVMIYMDRPFIVGDWIRSPDKEIEGTVEQIGWRLTHIRTFDKRMLYVPNSIFSSIAIENPSRMTNRRINETIGLRYDDVKKVDKILKEVKEMLTKHKAIDEKKTLMVNLDKFNEYSLDFFIYTFTHTTDWIEFHQIKQDILLKIEEIISKNKAQIAFPTSLINVESEIETKIVQK